MTAEQLLAQIYARPEDTDARMVYADWLLEHGDPRGELVQLQCRPQLDELGRRRVKTLLRKYSKRWLGPVSAVTETPTRIWDRGFLASARLEAGHFREMKQACGHPEWAMVRFLCAGHEHATELIASGAFRSLRTVTRLFPTQFRTLATRSTPTPAPIENVLIMDVPSYFGEDPVLTAWPKRPGLPRLRVLGVGANTPAELAWLAKSPIEIVLLHPRQRVNHPFPPSDVPRWLEAAMVWPLRGFGLQPFDVLSEATLDAWFVFERDTRGRLSKLRIRSNRPSEYERERAASWLGALAPRTLSELAIHGYEVADTAMLRAAAAHALGAPS